MGEHEGRDKTPTGPYYSKVVPYKHCSPKVKSFSTALYSETEMTSLFSLKRVLTPLTPQTLNPLTLP